MSFLQRRSMARRSIKEESRWLFDICCFKGKVPELPLLDPPQPLYELLLANTSRARQFRRLIRFYNEKTCFVRSSIFVDQSKSGKGVSMLRIKGYIHHMMPKLFGLGAPVDRPVYASAYIIDPSSMEVFDKNPMHANFSRTNKTFTFKPDKTINPHLLVQLRRWCQKTIL